MVEIFKPNKNIEKLILILIISMSLWFIYTYFVIIPNREWINNFFIDYKKNLIESPIKYRVFITDLIIQISKVLKINNYLLVYTTVMLVVFNFSIYQLFLFLEKAVNSIELLSYSILISYVFIVLSYTYHFYQPWSYLDIGLYSFSYRALFFNKKYNYNFFIIFSIALLNRETGIFIALLYLIHSLDSIVKIKSILNALLLFLYAIGVLFILRYFKGYEPSHDYIKLGHIFEENTQPGNLIIYFLILLCSGILYLAFNTNYDKRFRSGYLTMLFFMPLYLVYGIWIEIRMLLPFLPLLVLPLSKKMNEIINP